MTEQPRVLKSDAVFTVSTWRNLVAVTWWGTPEASRVAFIRRELEIVCSAQPGGLLVLMEAEDSMPSADARTQAASMIKALEKQLLFVCVLYPNHSVVANLLFATVRTMFLVTRGPKLKLTRQTADAATFVKPFVVPEVTERDVVELVSALRAHQRP